LYAVYVMSEDPENEFNIKDWLVQTKISEPGLKKLRLHEVRDLESLLLLSTSDIGAIKLATADKAKFVHGLKALFPKKIPELEDDTGFPVKKIAEKQSGDSSGNLANQPGGQPLSSTVGQPLPQPSSPVIPAVGVEGQLPETLQSQFSLSDVAGFLAGRPIPENLQQQIVNLGHAEVIGARNSNLNIPPANINVPPPSLKGYVGVGVGANPALHPSLPPSLQNAFAGLGFYDHSSVPSYDRVQPSLQHPQTYTSGQPSYSSPQGQVHQQSFAGNIPSYSSPLSQVQQQSYLPSRLNTVQSLSRDSYLQDQAVGYHQSSLRDNQFLNSCLPVRPGEDLFLPVNFCSHLKGHRSEDEELACTEGGTKLYLGSGAGKKVTPDKLNQGLFLGANARILSRIIPNITPEVVNYLDYIRKIGDLLVNYTSTSVYHLDHEHRFEVCERSSSIPFNFIDPTLSLNLLKKKDAVQNQSNVRGTSTGKSGVNSGAKGANSVSKNQGAPCWQYNQPAGCQFEPNCKYPHHCNVPGCKGDHPSYKHVFRFNSKSQSAITSGAQSQP
jgi:hypothetical protein